MASILKEKHGDKTRYRIQFRDVEGRWRRIRLFGVSQRDAESIAKKIEVIVSALIAGEPLPRAIADWVANAGDELRSKLVAVGLCESRQSVRGVTVTEWIDGYIERRHDAVEARCRINWKITRDKVAGFFGSKDITAITHDDAERFAVVMRNRFAQATAAGHIKRAKQFFHAAVRGGVVAKSPFSEIRAGSQCNDERKEYIPASNIDKVIDIAPDAEWRLLIALGRYAGLRVPSEALRLRWGDINWNEGTMKVESTKTRRQGKAFRIVPIFAELKPYLDDAWAVAKDGSTYCIERYRSQDANLRTHFRRLIAKVGLKQWPRTWHNLRASCETDLVDRFPLHIATAWLGNTPKVAEKHYLSVKPEHIAAAISGIVTMPATMTDGVEGVGQGVGQGLSKTDEIGSKATSFDIAISPTKAEFSDKCTDIQYAWRDSNPRPTV